MEDLSQKSDATVVCQLNVVKNGKTEVVRLHLLQNEYRFRALAEVQGVDFLATRPTPDVQDALKHIEEFAHLAQMESRIGAVITRPMFE